MSTPEENASNVYPIFGFRDGQVAYQPDYIDAKPYTAAEADMYVAWAGLPPREPGELWHNWAKRTAKSDVGKTALKLVDTEEGTNGTN